MAKKRFYSESELVFKEKPNLYNFKDLQGQKYSRLRVIGFYGVEKGRTFWYCKCECGNILKVNSSNLIRGKSNSCGCLCSMKTKEANTSHGHSRVGRVTKTYRTWQLMRRRCTEIDFPRYENYGGRGIKVCERWNDFKNFLADMGEHPGKGYSLDRKENNGNYCPENCRWATISQQANNKTTSHFLIYKGIKMTVTQWAEKLNIPSSRIFSQIKRGWSIERILNE